MNIFDQTKATKLIIVHTDDTAQYANYLQLMISAVDDDGENVVGVKDGTVETVVWNERDYIAQRPQLSSVDYILFIGKSKELKKECYGMQTKFTKYGMKYSWRGKRANLLVEEVVSRKEYDSFLEFAKKYQEDVKKEMEPSNIEMAQDLVTGATVAGTCFLTPFIPPVGLVTGGIIAGHGIIRGIKERKAVREQQYVCLILKFYMDGIKQFLNQ